MGVKWSTVSISGYKAGSPSDDGQSTEANRVKFSTIYTDLTDPIKTGVDSIVSKLDELFSQGNLAKSGAYTTVASDHTKTIEVTGATTITLLAASTATAGYRVGIKNVGSDLVTVARSGADTIDGATSVTLVPGESALYVVNQAVGGYAELGNSAESLIGNTLAIAEKTTTSFAPAVTTRILTDETLDLGSNYDNTNKWYTCPYDGYYSITSWHTAGTQAVALDAVLDAMIQIDTGGGFSATFPTPTLQGTFYREHAPAAVNFLRSAYHPTLLLSAGDIIAPYAALSAWDSTAGDLTSYFKVHCIRRV